jgi:hypothetical protein
MPWIIFYQASANKKNDVFHSQCGPRQNCLRPASNAQELERAMSDARNGMYQNIHLFFFRFSFAWFMRMIVSWKGRAKGCAYMKRLLAIHESIINQSIQLRSLSQSVKAYILTIAFSSISIHSRKSTTELVLLVWEDMAVRPQRRERHWYNRAHYIYMYTAKQQQSLWLLTFFVGGSFSLRAAHTVFHRAPRHHTLSTSSTHSLYIKHFYIHS